MRVGLLEDDVAIQEMLLLVLQDEGYTVVNFLNAEACLEALGVGVPTLQNAGLPIDVLLVDWKLNGPMTGTEVIREIRRRPNLQSLPVILTTAATFNDTEALSNLQITLLEKPFAVDDISSLIHDMTHGREKTL